MIRTQVSLDPQDYRLAKKEARRLGISLAELLRRSLRLLFPIRKSSPWMRFAGLVETGNPRSSSEVDELVYAEKD